MKKRFKNTIFLTLLVIFGLLFLSDFFFTWNGINVYQVIEEANPLMKWIFNLDFRFALSIRIILLVLIIVGLIYLKNNHFNISLTILILAIILNFYIMSLHLEWYNKYIGMINMLF